MSKIFRSGYQPQAQTTKFRTHDLERRVNRILLVTGIVALIAGLIIIALAAAKEAIRIQQIEEATEFNHYAAIYNDLPAANRIIVASSGLAIIDLPLDGADLAPRDVPEPYNIGDVVRTVLTALATALGAAAITAFILYLNAKDQRFFLADLVFHNKKTAIFSTLAFIGGLPFMVVSFFRMQGRRAELERKDTERLNEIADYHPPYNSIYKDCDRPSGDRFADCLQLFGHDHETDIAQYERITKMSGITYLTTTPTPQNHVVVEFVKTLSYRHREYHIGNFAMMINLKDPTESKIRIASNAVRGELQDLADLYPSSSIFDQPFAELLSHGEIANAIAYVLQNQNTAPKSPQLHDVPFNYFETATIREYRDERVHNEF